MTDFIRRADGTIDLRATYTDKHGTHPFGPQVDACRILLEIESVHPIRSRQVAAVALKFAELMSTTCQSSGR